MKNSDQNIERLKSVFDATSLGIVVFKTVRDSSGKIKDYEILMKNAVSEKWNGKEDHKILESFNKVMMTGQPMKNQHFYEDHGANNWSSVSAIRLNDNELVATIENITDLRLAEERNMELNRELQSMNRKLEILNSELKTFNQVAASDYDLTLKNLYTNLEFIVSNDAANLSNQSKANIRRAQTAIQKLKLLTEDIIAYTELDHNGEQKETVSLNIIVNSVLHDMKDRLLECNAVVEFDNLPCIQGYPSLLQLLFHNLIDNAIKFCGEGRPPVLKIGYNDIITGAETGNSEIRKDLNYHFLSFKDNGIGIQKEEAEKIFEIFYRQPDKGRYKGSGIGLAICRKIMAIHDGYILAEPGKTGAEFNCFFPGNEKN